MSKLVLVHPTGAVIDGDEETLYPVIADPPSEVGALQVITASVFPAVADTPVGAPGTVRGVIAEDGDDGSEMPAPFRATTVKVYERPLVRPRTVHVVSLLVVQVSDPGDEVTV